MRITVNGQRAEIQIKRSVEVSKWNSQKECTAGKDRKAMELNHYLDTVRTKVLKIHRELEQDGKPITADILKRRYYGEGDSPKMLLEVFREHNRKYRELMGKDYVAGTVLRYERTARYLSILRLSILASSDIETDFTSFSVCHIFSALIFTDFLSMVLFISSSELNLYIMK